MPHLLHCNRCRRDIVEEDYVFHTTFKTFDREHPSLCLRCERELITAIESFINEAINK